jgi:hypothetical protein
MTVKVENNEISQVRNRGIEVLARDAPNAPGNILNFTARNNVITLTGVEAAEGIFVSAGAVGGDRSSVCADINGNTATTAGPGLSAIRVRQRFLTSFTLEGYGGAPANDAAVASYLSTTNNLATATADHAATGSAGFLTTANCPEP